LSRKLSQLLPIRGNDLSDSQNVLESNLSDDLLPFGYFRLLRIGGLSQKPGSFAATFHTRLKIDKR
jgi:hypothetical protein